MATRTSTQTGNLSAGGTWVGGVAPVDNDLIVIATGHTVTVDIDISLGSNGSGVGDAMTIQATDQTTFGKLIVNDGVVLTLKGFGTASNRAMLINRYAQFEPAPGATIRVDCASNFQTIIDNRGVCNAIGTAPKPIIWDIPSANYSWNNDAVAESFSGSAHKFDPEANISCVAFTNLWIANAAGTGIGSLGDTSVSFGGTNAAAFGTEKALPSDLDTISATITTSGDYCIDYDMGIVYFYWNFASGNPSFTKTYKYLTNTKGWGITSSQNTTYNEAKFDYCHFKYMGPSTAADNRVLDVQNKQSAAVAANRLFYLTNSTFSYCYQPLGLKACTGTLADPLIIQGNTFKAFGGGQTFGGAISAYRSASTYCSFLSNSFKCRQPAFLSVFFSSGTNTIDLTGWVIDGNSATIVNNFVFSQHATVRWLSASITGNTLHGVGSAGDYRALSGISGASGQEVTISGNLLRRSLRPINYGSYCTFEKNIIDRNFHHGAIAPTEDDVKVSSPIVRNNLFIGESTRYDSSPSVESGYNHRHWIDGLQIVNNTLVGNPNGAVGFGDQQDTGAYTTCTNMVVANNLAKMTTAGSSKAWLRRADSANTIWRGHVLQFDYNLDHNYNTRYTNLNRQGTFVKGGSNYNTQTVATRNIPGVALFDPNFSSATGKQLDFTYTSATDQKLKWDGGTDLQLVMYNGTASATSTHVTVQGFRVAGTFTDSGASFNTTKNNAACPQGHWLKITGGTGSGQIRLITNCVSGTVLTVSDAWTTLPDNTSTYVIIKAELTLDDGADTVKAGIYLPSLPTATAQDTGIDFADHSVTGSDPLLVDAAGEDAIDYKIGSSSPAKDVATADYAPAADYFGTSRPQGAADDIGAHEFMASGGLLQIRGFTGGMQREFTGGMQR